MENELGQFIRNKRKGKNITLMQLAKKTNLSQPYLSQIENGKRDIPKPDIINKIASALDIDSYEIMVKAGYIASVKTGYSREFEDLLTEERKLIEEKDIMFQLINNERVYLDGKLLNDCDRKKIIEYLKLFCQIANKET
ncbi:helix-turn-helix transcriptional regulator [Bacillus sp. B190/17]|uniref:Helix-turn-helix transcriptional regulator n=1 Tax=Bacillus lumedeiriae TaxID=3058829 RepID=A0ABW8IDG8_9BACI